MGLAGWRALGFFFLDGSDWESEFELGIEKQPFLRYDKNQGGLRLGPCASHTLIPLF